MDRKEYKRLHKQKQRANKTYSDNERIQYQKHYRMAKTAFDDVATQAMTEDMEAANEKIKAKRRKYRIKKRDEKREAKQMQKAKAMENIELATSNNVEQL